MPVVYPIADSYCPRHLTPVCPVCSCRRLFLLRLLAAPKRNDGCTNTQPVLPAVRFALCRLDLFSAADSSAAPLGSTTLFTWRLITSAPGSTDIYFVAARAFCLHSQTRSTRAVCYSASASTLLPLFQLITCAIHLKQPSICAASKSTFDDRLYLTR
jgi:hypothetical protein